MWPFSRRSESIRIAGGCRDAAALGRRGEKLARRHLRRRGLKILAVNYRCPAGEADLIALDGASGGSGGPGGAETLVFVEVKTRTSDFYTDPAAAVDADKRARLRKIARCYLAAHRAEDLPVRFDVVAIVLRDGGRAEINHIVEAF